MGQEDTSRPGDPYEGMDREALIKALGEAKAGQAGQDRANSELKKQLADLQQQVTSLKEASAAGDAEIDQALGEFRIQQEALKAAASGRIPVEVALSVAGPDVEATKKNLARLEAWREQLRNERANELLVASSKVPQGGAQAQGLAVAGMNDRQVQQAIRTYGLPKFLEMFSQAAKERKKR